MSIHTAQKKVSDLTEQELVCELRRLRGLMDDAEAGAERITTNANGMLPCPACDAHGTTECECECGAVNHAKQCRRCDGEGEIRVEDHVRAEVGTQNTDRLAECEKALLAILTNRPKTA